MMSVSASQSVDDDVDPDFVYGQSPAISKINALVTDVARTNIPVLLTGESGTGKEVYGRLIHRLSSCSHRPINKLSCRTLEAPELLGYMKAFQHDGRSDGQWGTGTLFLDGIDEANLDCQKILISLLPDGDSKEHGKQHVRLIASAARDLENEIEEGRFRRELYFRINGVRIQLPPLRERSEDIPALIQHFLGKYTEELERNVPGIADGEMTFLQTHHWPGNVRELENLARKMVVLGDSRKAIDELRRKPKLEQAQLVQPTSWSLKVAARAASREAERDLICKALERTHWNRKRAARDLQISYKSLLYKIKQIGLDRAHQETGIKEGQ
jgi:two-component system, NtrC family, response regulator AtoC